MISKQTTINISVATLLGFCFLPATCPGSSPNTSKVDRLFNQWDRNDSPGAAIVIVKDGAVVYQRGYGYANLEHHIPITPTTLFDVASVAKQFTGLSAAMLIDQGKLSLDDDIRKHLPDLPDFGKPITIAHLLHHTSGLRDWPETLSLSEVDMEGPITLEMILEMVRRQRELDFPPGEEHLYSNTGYNLLAAIVAKISGESFRAWTGKNLFQPLGMKHTQVRDDPAEIVPNIADPYAPGDERKFHRVESQLAAQGSSSLLISAEDMGKWLLNFETGRIGGKAALKLMQQPGKLNNGRKVDYGFGIGLGDYHGTPSITHGGGWAGFRSFVLSIPEKRFGVAILGNAGSMDTQGLAMKIADLYLGHSSDGSSPKSSAKPAKATRKPDPASWERFLGTYRLGPGWLLTITRDGDQLMTQATHEEKFKMTPVSGTTFFVEAYGAAIEFAPDTSGAVNHLLYRGIKAPKLSLPQLTPEDLAAYAGDYWSEELRVVGRLEIHDKQLAIRDRAGRWIHLLPTGNDHFDAEVGQFSLEFTHDAGSPATELKVSGGRVRNLRFTRAILPKHN